MLLALLLQYFVVLTTTSPLLRHEIEEVHRQPDADLRRRDNPTVAVTGLTGFGIQPRLEIRQLETNADQWNIFLLGLLRFQQTDQSNLTAYYQIAGIHGRPFIAWDDVVAPPGVSGPGYCTHLLNLFLSWHRAYLALFEQTLYKHIVDAVNEFPAGSQRQRYASAALSWRFPYWDWAATPPPDQSAYPASFLSRTVEVTMPNGTTTIRNPLYSYQFHPVSAKDFYYDPFASWNETKRFPTDWNHSAISQDVLVQAVIDNGRVNFQDRLYNLFTNYNNFTEFGTETWIQPGVQNSDSLESIHDVIHGIVGSNGHMTYLDYSAFDPTFFLHHAMIDRCFALWQAIYPDSYVEPMAAIEQTFMIQVGDVKDETSALEPFFSNDNRDYWTAASVRSINVFGYTYPELENNADASAVRAAINNLYGNSAGSSGLSKRTPDERAVHDRELPAAASAMEVTKVPGEVVRGKHRQYLANILSQKFALNASYAIYLFMGDFDDNPSAWATSPNLVGTHAVFGAISMQDSSNNIQSSSFRSKPSIQVTGTVPLTSMLLAKVRSGELSGMGPQTVGNYLTDNLHWRVGMFDGTQVPAEDVADLSVTVVTAQVRPASSEDQFPSWSDFTKLTHITRGKPGGC